MTALSNTDLLTRLGLLIRPSFFEKAFCAELRSEIDSAPRHQVPVYSERLDGEEVDAGERVGWRAAVAPRTLEAVTDRLVAARGIVAGWFNVPISGCEPPQFILYGSGGFYRPHRDSATPDEPVPEMFKARKISAVVFLSGEADTPAPARHVGGSLTFYGLIPDERWRDVGFPLRGEEGMLVAFPPMLLHEVSPVMRGERVTVVTCFY